MGTDNGGSIQYGYNFEILNTFEMGHLKKTCSHIPSRMDLSQTPRLLLHNKKKRSIEISTCPTRFCTGPTEISLALGPELAAKVANRHLLILESGPPRCYVWSLSPPFCEVTIAPYIQLIRLWLGEAGKCLH